MFSLAVQNQILSFKDIKRENLPQILDWYNMVDKFKFATGIDTPITMEQLERKYAEVAICSSEFLVGVYVKNEPGMVGILKGYIKYENTDAVWISSLVIEPAKQNRGYGSRSVELLLAYLKRSIGIKSAYLAVIESNLPGRRFWERLGFSEIRRIENHLKLQDKRQNVIIMGRQV